MSALLLHYCAPDRKRELRPEVHAFHHSLLYLLANARIRLFCFKPMENGILKCGPLRFDGAAFRRQFLQEKGISQRGHIGGLLVVGCAAMAPFNVFVI